METAGLALSILTLALLFGLYLLSGRLLVRLAPGTARAAGWAALAFALASLLGWFILGDDRLMPAGAAGIVVYLSIKRRAGRTETEGDGS